MYWILHAASAAVPHTRVSARSVSAKLIIFNNKFLVFDTQLLGLNINSSFSQQNSSFFPRLEAPHGAIPNVLDVIIRASWQQLCNIGPCIAENSVRVNEDQLTFPSKSIIFNTNSSFLIQNPSFLIQNRTCSSVAHAPFRNCKIHHFQYNTSFSIHNSSF